MEFVLDTKLAKDSILVADLALSQLRLLNNAHYTWLLLVPRLAEVTELIDLNSDQQQQLLSEINLVSNLLKQHFQCDKLNIATLGNMVIQLHIHVIARRRDDIQWPKTVWGGPEQAYPKETLIQTVTQLQNLLRGK